jgi:hypothetical protein
MSNKNVITRELNKEQNAIKLDIEMTNLKKKAFIDEIKSGLGDAIKNNPDKVIIHKITLFQKIKNFLIKIFIKI